MLTLRRVIQAAYLLNCGMLKYLRADSGRPLANFFKSEARIQTASGHREYTVPPKSKHNILINYSLTERCKMVKKNPPPSLSQVIITMQ